MLRDLLILYTLFFRMGAVTFGGGYAMLPILRREIIQNHQWMDEETIMDYYALSQGLPGIIAINVSVFIGYRRRGFPAVWPPLWAWSPPASSSFPSSRSSSPASRTTPMVQHALAGISVCVAALILDAVISMWKKGVKDAFGIVVCLVMLCLSVFTDLSPILLVIACALLGIGAKKITGSVRKEGEGK